MRMDFDNPSGYEHFDNKLMDYRVYGWVMVI